MASVETIQRILVKLKETSEIMTDLAYFSILNQNKDVAKHVLELEEEVDSLHTELGLEVLKLRGNRPEKGLLGLIQVGVASENIADAATSIAELVFEGPRPHPVMNAALNEADEVVAAFRLSRSSILANKSIAELGLHDDIGVWIIATKRRNKWYFDPDERFVLKSDDLVLIRGSLEGRDAFLSLAQRVRNQTAS